VALAPGTRLGPYEIAAQIGVGGMGEVWCATDTNLGRQVAIKILPDAFAHDPTPDSLIVVQHWFEELKRRVPTN
jgi:serine/threonine protein kinase